MRFEYVSRMLGGQLSYSLMPKLKFGSKRRTILVCLTRCQTEMFSRTLSTGRGMYNHLELMKAWVINQYGSNEVLEMQSVPVPRVRGSTDVLVRVHAASVNPIDYRMRSGYGETLLNLWRKFENVSEFPLILGRDFSGEVVKTGRLARRFRPGDQVSDGCHSTRF